jgi:hypothetical protein
LDGNAVFTPEPLGNDEGERLPVQGMEGMGDPNQWGINGTGCS